MMNPYVGNYMGSFMSGSFTGWLNMFQIPLAFWSAFWMGLALWKAAKKDHKIWFVALLLVHTLGILDILYIFVFSKIGEKKAKVSKKK